MFMPQAGWITFANQVPQLSCEKHMIRATCTIFPATTFAHKQHFTTTLFANYNFCPLSTFAYRVPICLSTTFSHWQHLPNSTFPHLHNVHSLKKDKWWQRLLMVIGGHVLLWAKLLWENVVVGKYRCGKMLQCTWRNVVYAMGECCQFWQKMLWPKVTWWVNVAWRASRANVWWANVIHSFSIRSAVQRT